MRNELLSPSGLNMTLIWKADKYLRSYICSSFFVLIYKWFILFGNSPGQHEPGVAILYDTNHTYNTKTSLCYHYQSVREVFGTSLLLWQISHDKDCMDGSWMNGAKCFISSSFFLKFRYLKFDVIWNSMLCCGLSSTLNPLCSASPKATPPPTPLSVSLPLARPFCPRGGMFRICQSIIPLNSTFFRRNLSLSLHPEPLPSQPREPNHNQWLVWTADNDISSGENARIKEITRDLYPFRS